MSPKSPRGAAAAAREKGVSVETAPTLAKVTRSLAGSEGSGCPDENTIAGLIGGVLEPAEIERLGQHIDDCSHCAALVNELGAVLAPDGEGQSETAGSASARTKSESVSTPKQLGRYQVLEPLGAGGMGVVTLAYDPQLKRNVALKLIRPELLASSAEPEMRARLLREAQALASLSHPNVVAVHDVGTWEDGLFIAMEYVAGSTVAEWVRQESPGWRAITDVFLQAGRGLAAAHGAGLVHRDVKPSNILVDADGRARVTDFGLARDSTTADPIADASPDSEGPEPADASPHDRTELATGPVTPASQPPSDSGAEDSTGSLTRTGAILGTPAYMSPEQHAGEPADARSDQFSFCVALYEALAGQRPFPGDSLEELARSVRTDPSLKRDLAGVPRSVRETLRRGLRTQPADRFSTMVALLERLEEGLEGAGSRPEAATEVAAGAAAAGPTARVREAPPPRQRSWLAVVLSATALLLVVGLVLWVAFRQPAPSRGQRAGVAAGHQASAQIKTPGPQVVGAGAADAGAPLTVAASPAAANPAGATPAAASPAQPPQPGRTATHRRVTPRPRPRVNAGASLNLATAKKRAAEAQRSTQLYLQVLKLERTGKAKRCLAALAELKRLAPATYKRLRYYAATCSMLAGRCQQGKRLLRAHLKTVPHQTPAGIAASVKATAARKCPTSTLSLDGRFRKLSVQLFSAYRTRAVATCARLTRKLHKMMPGLLKARPKRIIFRLGSAFQTGATCLARGGRCSQGRRAWIVAQRLQLSGSYSGAKLTQIAESTFRASFANCAP